METQDFSARVSHLSAQGLGLVKDSAGQSYLVRGVWPADEGLFRPSGEHEGPYPLASLIRLDTPAPERRDTSPLCPHMGTGPQQCFGCSWLFASEEAQLRQKEYRVRYSFERMGLRLPPMQPIWPSPTPFAYRRRAQFKTDGQLIGYAAPRGQGIVPIASCPILNEPLQEKLSWLKGQLPNARWEPEPPHLWNYIDIDCDEPSREITLNRRRPFQQANAAQNVRMRAWVREQLAGLGPSPLLELFAGSGNFTDEAVALALPRILAVEVSATAVAALSARHGQALEARRIDLYKSSAMAELAAAFPEAETLLVNPPRDGLKQLARLPRQLPRLTTILYISCDPITLAADCRNLSKLGFQLELVQPLDQMPQTPHVEVLVRLSRPVASPATAPRLLPKN